MLPKGTARMFKDGPIEGVEIRPLTRYSDQRGWLMELFRTDELDGGICPVMAFISITRPGASRGPDEHKDQTDYFCFIGSSDFKVLLWDNRPASPTYRNRMVMTTDVANPSVVIVPPSVVHAFRNIGKEDGLVINCPNRLFKGESKKGPVDEIRYGADSLYRLD